MYVCAYDVNKYKYKYKYIYIYIYIHRQVHLSLSPSLLSVNPKVSKRNIPS